jgi:hypothetical protein
MSVDDSLRKQSMAALKRAGFRAAASLPLLRENAGLRPLEEIARRLMALKALFYWVSQLQVEEKKLRDYAAQNELVPWMTLEERKIWKSERARANEAHCGTIGWRLENMWPLAWILGFSAEPPFDGKMIEGETIDALFKFLQGLSTSVKEQLSRGTPRSERDVMAMEDLFYCAHNAARSAQLGENTVPPGFDPVASGGVIHERRHALTWATSPGEPWDDTDLST